MPGSGTTSVHGPDDAHRREGPINTPIERSTTYRFTDTDALIEQADAGVGFYTRYGHRNFVAVEERYAALSGGEAAVLFATGMAALAAVVQGFCRVGDRVAVMADCYGGTRALLDHMQERGEIQLEVVPFDALADLAPHLEGVRVFFGESPTNPCLRIVDLGAVATACRAAGTLFVLDATFAGPTLQQPLREGVDLVLESATKQLAGHSDVMGGLVAGSTERIDVLRHARKLYGAVADPETAWLIERGMKTLDVRARRQQETAASLATWLGGHAKVGRVNYPGTGGMLSFTVDGGGAGARRFVDALHLVANGPSLGGVESLVSLPRFTSHAHLSAAERASLGVTDDLVRLSVGLEDAADLRADIERGLAAV